MLTHVENQLQKRPVAGGNRRVAEHLLERLPLLQDASLFQACSAQVAHVVAREVRGAVADEERDGCNQDSHADPLLSHGVQRTPNRWTPLPRGLSG